MSTFVLPNSDRVEVSLVDGLSEDQLLEFPAFKNWVSNLQHNLGLQTSKRDHEFHSDPYTLKKINVQSVDRFGKGKRLGFVKLTAEVSNGSGETLPGSVFLRGPSVAMLVILQPDELPKESKDEKHVILTLQPRVPAASLSFAELPAGMVEDGSFSGSAAREIKEELGLDIPESELTNLTELVTPPSSTSEKLPVGFFPSAGGCDEYVPIFLHQKRVPRDQLKEWTGKLTGLREEGEKITLKLVRMDDLWKEGATDSKALAAWALWEGLTREGQL